MSPMTNEKLKERLKELTSSPITVEKRGENAWTAAAYEFAVCNNATREEAIEELVKTLQKHVETGRAAQAVLKKLRLPVPGLERKPRCANVDWDKVEDLGKVPDKVLAERLGCSVPAVYNARRLRKIPSVRQAGLSGEE
jgi:hypothetical protein